jgi:D-alanine transaminase
MQLCYLNGEFQDLANAKISVLDRGFIFGDGIYEVVPVYARRLFRFEQHMARLTRSLSKVGMSNPLESEAWLALCRKLVESESATDQVVYIQVTRGVARRDHPFPKDTPQTVFAMVNPMVKPSEKARAEGVACVSTQDLRWLRGDVKSTSLLGVVLSRQLSAEVGATETILFRDGMLTEATASNVWVVKDGVLKAPKKDHLKLEGIRYGLLEELCKREGQTFELCDVTEAEVRSADELMLSSATKEVLAITKLDNASVGAGKPGPVYAKLYAAYQAAITEQSI